MTYAQGEAREYALKSRPGVKVTIRTPTERMRRRLTPKERPAEEDLSGFFDWAALVVSATVEGVAGYEHRGREIATGADLAEYGETEPLVEVAGEAYSELSLSEAARKNSGAPSDTPPSADSAAPVAAPGA